MNRETKKTFLLIFFIVLLLPFFKIPILARNDSIMDIYNILEINSFLLIILYMIKNKSFKISKINIYIIIYCLILILSSFFNNISIESSFFTAIRTIIFCIIVEQGVRCDKKTFFRAMSILLSIFVYLNFISVFIYENGMYVNSSNGHAQNWILGFKNGHIIYILPAVLSSCIYSYLSYGKLKNKDYLLTFVSLLTLIKVESSASIVSFFFIFLFIFFSNILKNSKIFNIFNYFATYIVSFISIIFFNIQQIFYFFIVDVLKKRLSFTGRTYIWNKGLDLIKSKWILGYGLDTVESKRKQIDLYEAPHLHNQILEVMYQSGLIGLICYFIIIILPIKKLFNKKDNKIAKFISIVLFSYFIRSIFEYDNIQNVLFLFVIAYNIDYIIDNKKI